MNHGQTHLAIKFARISILSFEFLHSHQKIFWILNLSIGWFDEIRIQQMLQHLL